MYNLKKKLERKIKYGKKAVEDFWYEKVLKKDKPSPLIDHEGYVALIKDEVYRVWPTERMVEVLASYGTNIRDVQLPEDLSEEQLKELSQLAREMRRRYIRVGEELVQKIESGELDCNIVLHKKYIKRRRTRRQALMLDELLEGLERLKPLPIEEDEDDNEPLTLEVVKKRFECIELYMELETFTFISAVLNAQMAKTYEELLELFANAPWKQATAKEG